MSYRNLAYAFFCAIIFATCISGCGEKVAAPAATPSPPPGMMINIPDGEVPINKSDDKLNNKQ